MQKGKLFLIPNTLGSDDISLTIPVGIKDVINNIDCYIVENIKTAAKFLKLAGLKKNLKELTFYVLNVNTPQTEISGYLDEAESGKNIGLISEAGLPCIADPGNVIVKLAHGKNIRVVPLTGPSSIMLALMASGFNGQEFAFNGYLPIDKIKRREKLKELEKKVKFAGTSQVFIEAPHRNDRLIEEMIGVLKGDTGLCIASELTGGSELIQVMPVNKWKQINYKPGKVPVIYILGKL